MSDGVTLLLLLRTSVGVVDDNFGAGDTTLLVTAVFVADGGGGGGVKVAIVLAALALASVSSLSFLHLTHEHLFRQAGHCHVDILNGALNICFTLAP